MEVPMSILIKNGRVVDSSTGMDGVYDILVKDEKIEKIAKNILIDNEDSYEIIDATGKVIIPGIVDIHVHLREPGFEHKETIESGTYAAVAGGVTTVACMPNTNPAIHSKEVVELIQAKAEETGHCKVKVIGAITKSIQGYEMAPIDEMIEAGIVGVSDDGRTTMNNDYMSEAFEIIEKHNMPLISHAEDHDVTAGACMNQGENSEKLGVKGMPATAESDIVKRDIDLCKEKNAKLHIAHVSVGESLEHIIEARKEGVEVTCEIAPHHFILNDGIVDVEDACSKVNPPIRDQKQVEKMVEGIINGTIDAIATDHAPHDEESKSKGFEKSAFGISGIETSFALSYTGLVKKGHINMLRLVEMMCLNPARIINIDAGTLNEGTAADLAIIDLEKEYIIDGAKFHSKGKNTPFNGMKVNGVIEYTLVNGKIVYKEEK